MAENIDKKSDDILSEVTSSDYKYGFETKVETEFIGKGLSEDVVRIISQKKEEPEWLLEFRLKAYRHWLTLDMPKWAHLNVPEIDYQDIVYYAAPKTAVDNEKKEIDPSPAPSPEKEAADLSFLGEQEKALYLAIPKEGTCLPDDLVAEEMTAIQVMRYLTNLEMEGLILRHAGGRISRA